MTIFAIRIIPGYLKMTQSHLSRMSSQKISFRGEDEVKQQTEKHIL